ncbi:MAG: helix-hairpin-helix domain-containing protein [Paenibacillus sp.]|uniref:Helix-hairpin-helix motif-containing protein n=1 Tax=Paenibacillus aquistagni TaxID=1852522 RepID=A0A1X7K8P5_9BACL|nr:helix-hairpin-helix domain-containing protein [Paenibacillus aquistagni]MBR2570456.1 helix-hairpin-helix domain-containing protein [Paenibacillus sp.]SMG37084.1 Helix-hairpin-helix motif-containing protein [Paenibacillus aquistagni]
MESNSRETKASWLESWWILLPFTAIFNWAAFIYIGARARNTRWILWGAVYFLPYALHEMTGFFFGSIVIGVICSIIHAFSVRKEFLARIEGQREKKEMLESDPEQYYKMALGRMVDHSAANDQDIPSLEEMNVDSLMVIEEDEELSVIDTLPQESQATSEILDINTALEEEIAALPGVGLILAKKAVQVRSRKGSYHSIDEFLDVLQLKPRFADRVRPLIMVQAQASPPPTPRGRVVDY